MTEVMELAGSFASICKDERIVPASRMTQDAICSEMIEPANCVELSTNDMEYVTGEWGWFANHNLKYSCAWNDGSGVEWLMSRAGWADTFAVIADGAGLAIQIGGALFTGGLSYVIGEAIANIANFWCESVAASARNGAVTALGLMGQRKGYKVFEDTVMWNTMINGYSVEQW